VKRNNGRLTATCTRDTVIGLASRLVINQPDAVSNIAVPTFETRLAVHITVNARWLNGPHRERAGAVGAAAVVRSEPLMTFSGNHIHFRRHYISEGDSHGGESTGLPVLAQLKDIHRAEKRIFRTLSKIAKAAEMPELSQAFMTQREKAPDPNRGEQGR
jgi:hypothetical protein